MVATKLFPNNKDDILDRKVLFDSNSGCTASQQRTIEEAVKDATKLARFASGAIDSVPGQATAEYYMGPNMSSFRSRITANYKRVGEFLRLQINTLSRSAARRSRVRPALGKVPTQL